MTQEIEYALVDMQKSESVIKQYGIDCLYIHNNCDKDTPYDYFDLMNKISVPNNIIDSHKMNNINSGVSLEFYDAFNQYFLNFKEFQHTIWEEIIVSLVPLSLNKNLMPKEIIEYFSYRIIPPEYCLKANNILSSFDFSVFKKYVQKFWFSTIYIEGEEYKGTSYPNIKKIEEEDNYWLKKPSQIIDYIDLLKIVYSESAKKGLGVYAHCC